MEKVVMSEPYVKVIYDTEKQIGKVIWSGSPTPEQYKKPFLALLDLAAKGTPVPRFLSDTREQGVFWQPSTNSISRSRFSPTRKARSLF